MICCYLDNDAIVKKNFIKSIDIFNKIKKEQELPNDKILLMDLMRIRIRF